jgi:hypothetical protein
MANDQAKAGPQQGTLRRRPAATDLVQLLDVRMLAEHRGGPCVSIFLPTHRTAPGSEQDPIRLKNLLSDAESRLTDRGLRSSEARELLSPGRELLDRRMFWQHQSDGLALFAAPGFFRTWRIALTLPERCEIAERFAVTPLMPLLTTDGRFFVLAISQRETRLLEGSRQTVEELRLHDVPDGLADTIRYDDLEPEHLLHVAGRGGPAIFHGHGIGDEIDKVLQERYLREVDAGLWDILREERVPLVLAGVEPLVPMFRGITRYPHVLDEVVAGTPDALRAEELHARAWAIVEPVFERARAAAADRYRELAGRGERVTDRPEAAARAAEEGRVDTLCIGPPDATSEDPIRELVEQATAATLLTSGSVYAYPDGDMPTDSAVAAILRY